MAAPEKPSPLARGVIMSWLAQFIQIASGFIVPRLIDKQLGGEILGVWDLGWAAVSYFTLLDAGVSSTVNRYVALHRSENDHSSLNRIVSSVALIQRAIGTIILALTFFVAWKVATSLALHSPNLAHQGKWLVILLGSSIAIGMAGAVYGGIVTGAHRWQTHHGIYLISNIVSLLAMFVVLKLQQGLIALAAVHLGAEFLGRVLRALAASRYCPEIRISRRHADWSTIQTLFRFGGKMFIGRMSQIIMNQSVSIMMAATLGPAALAMYARPRSLIKHAATFPQKYGNMLVPTAAALLGKKDQNEIRQIAIQTTRDGLYMSLPLLLFLAVCGGALMQLWMGKHYVNAYLLAILSLGFLAEIAYQPLNNVLFALNLHGRPGIASIIGAASAVTAVAVVLGSGSRDLNALAWAIVVPWSVVHGLYVPLYACRKLGIPIGRFLRGSWAGPLAFAAPFSFCLFVPQWFIDRNSPVALAVGAVLGGLTLFVLYWLWVFPVHWKSKLKKLCGLSKKDRATKSISTEQMAPLTQPSGISGK